ncbi:hypothetical protein I316_07176 [Kwoniella heveanensis BCC8398]|uniref:Uncharacterized protein n=1 Tax=Kwoniella heveanensis BCC8398 TaxID=1296120 RepID=A0A1B9GJR4_9TREE|nr:hypothetical protein I316_07176 [Kwoniella heveanensis BCC8398]
MTTTGPASPSSSAHATSTSTFRSASQATTTDTAMSTATATSTAAEDDRVPSLSGCSGGESSHADSASVNGDLTTLNDSASSAPAAKTALNATEQSLAMKRSQAATHSSTGKDVDRDAAAAAATEDDGAYTTSEDEAHPAIARSREEARAARRKLGI